MIIDTIILAIIQAITEFLPVSSSGHLILSQELFDIESNIGMDVMLHLGTLVALIIYFWGDLVGILRSLLHGKSPHLFWLLIIATIPAVIIGGLFEDFLDNTFRNIGTVIVMLFIGGVAMLLIDKFAPKTEDKTAEKLSYKTALIIGLWQCLAFIPGTSRSGITMLSGRWQKLTYVEAARFSFLIGIPAIFGATIKILFDSGSRNYITDNFTATVVGIAVSAVLGLLAIKLLLDIVKKLGLKPFGWYRIALSGLLAILIITG